MIRVPKLLDVLSGILCTVLGEYYIFCQLTESGSQGDVWLACMAADLNCDGEVNLLDFAELAGHWLE